VTRAELEDRLNKEPFEPLRVHTADGQHYDIVNPRLAVPMDTRLFIALPHDRWTLIVLRQVTSVGDVPPADRRNGESKRRGKK
jgi:hypothetical protein